jgi:hypothetical protein
MDMTDNNLQHLLWFIFFLITLYREIVGLGMILIFTICFEHVTPIIVKKNDHRSLRIYSIFYNSMTVWDSILFIWATGSATKLQIVTSLLFLY